MLIWKENLTNLQLPNQLTAAKKQGSLIKLPFFWVGDQTMQAVYGIPLRDFLKTMGILWVGNIMTSVELQADDLLLAADAMLTNLDQGVKDPRWVWWVDVAGKMLELGRVFFFLNGGVVFFLNRDHYITKRNIELPISH